MGSSGLDLSLDASPVQRSKEENQERAFVAASRRKDRSLDARLESANRASMLHKKRTGKALHITKDIVEREAMYEEIDERYQEKRLSILKAHTTELEAQFHRHLMATMAMNKTSRQQQQQQQQQQTRISHHGGIQKMRNLSLGSNEGVFRPETHLKLQNGGSPISPTASSSTVPSPTSPVFEVYGGGSSSFSSATSSDVSSFVQTPATSCYGSVPLACPQYVDTGLMSPSVSPRNSIYQQKINSVQPTHLRSASIALAQSSRSNAPLFSRRLASYPDVSFMIPSASMGGVSGQATAAGAATNFNFQAIPNPSSQSSATPSPTSCVPTASTPGMANMQENGLLPSPALSTGSMSPDSSHNVTQYSDQIVPPEVQVEFDEVDPFKQQPILGSPENPDPDYNEFLDFASSMEDHWQFPAGNNNTSFDDLVNLDSLDYEFSHTGMYR